MVLMLSWRNSPSAMNDAARDDACVRRDNTMLSKAVSWVVFWYMLPRRTVIEVLTMVLMLGWKKSPRQICIYRKVGNWLIRTGVFLSC